MTDLTLLQKLSKRGTDFLGSTYPIIGGAMASISNHAWVSAVVNAGAFAFLSCGFLNPAQLEQEIELTQQATSKPFGVNLIVLHPQIMDLIDVCIRKKVSHVILASGVPTAEMIQKLKEGGVKAMTFAPTAAIGKRLIKNGIDALVIEGHESGGHIGPVSTIVLMQEVMPFIQDVPVFVAGGIGTGRMIAACLMMGAAGCQMGTSFICIQECPVHDAFKKAYIRAASRNAVPTMQMSPTFPVIPVRSLYNKAHDAFAAHQLHVIEDYENERLTIEQARTKIETFWAGALKKAVLEGDVDNGSVMAGQIVGLVKQESTAQEVVARLMDETQKALEEMKSRLNEG